MLVAVCTIQKMQTVYSLLNIGITQQHCIADALKIQLSKNKKRVEFVNRYNTPMHISIYNSTLIQYRCNQITVILYHISDVLSRLMEKFLIKPLKLLKPTTLIMGIIKRAQWGSHCLTTKCRKRIILY